MTESYLSQPFGNLITVNLIMICAESVPSGVKTYGKNSGPKRDMKPKIAEVHVQCQNLSVLRVVINYLLVNDVF